MWLNCYCVEIFLIYPAIKSSFFLIDQNSWCLPQFFFMISYFHILLYQRFLWTFLCLCFNAKFVIWKSSWKLYIYYIKINNNISLHIVGKQMYFRKSYPVMLSYKYTQRWRCHNEMKDSNQNNIIYFIFLQFHCLTEIWHVNDIE